MTTPEPAIPDGTILFDGVCVLCSAAFRFVARRDRAVQFRFVAIQDGPGRRIAATLGIDPDAPGTVAVVLGGRVFTRSDAAIEVLRRLPFWRWACPAPAGAAGPGAMPPTTRWRATATVCSAAWRPAWCPRGSCGGTCWAGP